MSRETARYTYLHGSRPEGVATYDDDTSVTSHHDTDPARGTHNAFDLVRLHRFGHLDKDTDKQTPITDRPSYKAMCAFAANLPEVRAARAKEEMTNMGEAPPAELPAEFDGGAATTPPAFSILDADEFADTADEQPNDQVAGVIPSVGVGQMVAPSSSGKSFVAIDVAAHIALGKEYHGRKVTQGRALYICAEGARGVKKRLRAWKKHHGVTDFGGRLKVLTAAPNLYKPKEIGELLSAIDAAMPERPTWIAIDTRWRCATGSDENSASDQATIFASADRLAHAYNAFVLLLAHTGYGDQTRARGSSAQYAACDTELTVERTGDYCTVRVSKAKDSESGAALSFKSAVIDLGENPHGERESSLVLIPANPVDVATARAPKGVVSAAILDYVKASGETRFTVKGLAADFAESLKGKRKLRAANVERAIRVLVGSHFTAYGDEIELRQGLVCDPNGWLG